MIVEMLLGFATGLLVGVGVYEAGCLFCAWVQRRK